MPSAQDIISKFSAERDVFEEEYEPVRVAITFEANPKEQTIDTSRLGEGNFQWDKYGLHFKVEDKDEYYSYILDLKPNGDPEGPGMVFKSDSKSRLHKDESINMIPADIPRIFKNLFEGRKPVLTPDKPISHRSDPDVRDTFQYLNTFAGDPKKEYDYKKFRAEFDQNFYTVMDPHSKRPRNPFGDPIPENILKSKPEEEEKEAMDQESVNRYAVLLARYGSDDEAFSGGFDIMRKFQEKERKKQRKKDKHANKKAPQKSRHFPPKDYKTPSEVADEWYQEHKK